jgi:hypothetical protein
MANTPEVDEWLEKTNNLTRAAISLASGTTIDYELGAMMRQVQSGCAVLLTALQRLPPAAPPPLPASPDPDAAPVAATARRKAS